MLENVNLPSSLRISCVITLTLAALALVAVADDVHVRLDSTAPLAPPSDLQSPGPQSGVPTATLSPPSASPSTPPAPLTLPTSASPSAHAPPSQLPQSQGKVVASTQESHPSIPPIQLHAVPKVAQPIGEVFVPLQKWKERKLQDIESRVKQDTKFASGKKRSKNGRPQRRRRTVSSDAHAGHFLSRRQQVLRDIFWKTCPLLPEDALPASSGNSLSTPGGKTPQASLNPLPSPSVSHIPLNIPVIKHASPSAEITDNLTQEFEELTDKQPANEPIAPSNSLESSIDATDTNPELATESQERSIDKIEKDEIALDRKGERKAPQESASSAVQNAADTDALDTAKNARAPLLDLKSLGEKVRQLRNTVSTVVKLTPTLFENNTLHNATSSNSAPKCAIRVDPSENSGGKPVDSPGIVNSDTVRKRKDKNTVVSKAAKNRKVRISAADAAAAAATATASAAFITKNRKSFNFASEGSGAQILASSENAVGAKNIITENSDKYMLVPCAGDGLGSRWVDIELSEYVILKSVQTANYEHYSSAARKFAVLGAEKYPPEEWIELGVFDFANTRELQTFYITGANRRVSRFLRVIYAGKHGHEYYCPVSIFRAFGKNLIADLKEGFETPGDDIKEKKPVVARAKVKDLPAKESATGYLSGASAGSHEGKKSSDGTAGKKDKETRNTSHADMGAEKDNESQGAAEDAENASTDKSDGNSNRNLHSEKGELSSDDQIVLDVVREETLAPVSGDDNIFRRVTRMIRLLELNQSLTNQYIDTHLARYAAALSATQAEAAKGAEAAAIAQARVAGVAAALERSIDDMRAASLRRDMLLCALLVLIGFLLGTHWVMWTALSGVRVAVPPSEPPPPITETSPISSPEGSTLEHGTENPGGASRIVEVVSVDGVHVQLTEARRRRRRGPRRATPGVPRSPPGAVGDTSDARSASYIPAIISPAQIRDRTLPPLSAASPRGVRRLYNSNSFQLLSEATDVTREGNRSDG